MGDRNGGLALATNDNDSSQTNSLSDIDQDLDLEDAVERLERTEHEMLCLTRFDDNESPGNASDSDPESNISLRRLLENVVRRGGIEEVGIPRTPLFIRAY